MAFTPFMIVLITLFSGLATSQELETVELDQIFPRNETYAPVRYFPFVWGLQNAAAAYPAGFKLYWRLSPVESPIFILEEDGRFPEDTPIDAPYSYGPPPLDPLFFSNFPLTLKNFSTGHWELEWRFGFKYNCSLSDPVILEDHYRKQPWHSVVFTVAEGGKSVDLIENQDCDTEADQAAAFKLLQNEDDENCPILNTTVPNPCALAFGTATVENITTAARDLGRCPSFNGTLADFPVDCDSSGIRVSVAWTGRWVLLGFGWLANMLL
ncbi:hypothetical protein BDW72DRAFT_170382 [Aspergillus terricola var. indicus]